ncbi:alpha/beta fold hydrolase [Streptomyces griseorubiginosus]|uniref:alpha/beta fold hydrolase n=1 Tax=Streptomyces griseorubiginosus TaxID=67304 RepID=UPI0011402843|nr:alpha/beta hydrolase [Streptomyces griseorubiginosus]
MLGPEARLAVARLAAAVLSVRPLVEGIAAPVRVAAVDRDAEPVPGGQPPAQWRALRALLARVARRTGVSGLVLSGEEAYDDLQVFERVISERLALADLLDSVGAVPVDRLGEVDSVVDTALRESFDGLSRRGTVISADGTPLNAYAAGEGEETVVLVPACGMPAALAEAWVRYFARNRRVLTWESRGLFGAEGVGEEQATGIDAQAGDLFAVMDHHGASAAHVIGLCGGAAIALAAAAELPSRVCSLSLWHGAYGFGENYPMTAHQQGLIELMTTAARSRTAAEAVHAAFCQAILTSTPADVAHFVLYPYASPELLYRYCRLNLGITGTDVEPYLDRVGLPTLVVTSRDDDIAHPEGSQRVAAGLPQGQLRVEPHGDHISLFSADASLLRVAEEFMERHRVPAH